MPSPAACRLSGAEDGLPPAAPFGHAGVVQPGDLLADRFVIERLAGAGGMGTVYRALDRAQGAPVALKLLNACDPRDQARFAREARIVAELDHPGVVRCVAHDVTAAGQRWLAMEWLDGEDLSARLGRAGLSVDESVAAMIAAADALAAAHARGVVHRDIKPSNLFLVGGDPRRVKLLDFGIARLSGASRVVTRPGAIMGTPGYMAPEQAAGEQTDARTDVFSLGAVLFECLTGRPAFMGRHLMALLARLLLEEPPRVRELRGDVPPALDDLVARMLAKNPAARPADAAGAAAALRSLGELGASLPAPRSPDEATSRRAADDAITGGEQRVLSVVVSLPAGGSALALDDTLPADTDTELRPRIQAALFHLGARVDRLANGAVLLTLQGAGSATDQAARAARCALLLGPLLAESQERQELRGGCVAIVTGSADISGRLPVGRLLDRAASLLASGPPRGGVARLDDVTQSLLDPRFDVAPGPSGWELLGEREIGEGARTLLGRPSPCVGRDRELRTIIDLFDECTAEGLARAVLVTGPPGIGKSRLRDEALRRLRALKPGVEIWIGRGDVVGDGAPFGVLGSAIRNAAGAPTGAPLPERRALLAARVARRVAGPAQRRVAEFLGEIAGVPFPDDVSPPLRAARQSAQLMGEQIGRAFADFVKAEVDAAPLCLVMEDLHWGDAPSVRLVDQALDRLADRPLFVMALARPEVCERFPRLWADRSIRLGPLPPRAAERLVRHALGDAASAPQVAALVERAAGNAFYLEELIRAVAEGQGEALPETVLAMVQARLAALAPAARRVLRAASVFGEVFWPTGLSRVLGGESPMASVAASLAALVDQEILVRHDQSRFPGEDELAFRHALLREGAYATLTEADRARGHTLAAAWLEAAGEVDPAVLAEHLERGGELACAAVRYAQAAERLLRGGDPAGAIRLAERGARCGAEGELLATLRVTQGEATLWAGDLQASVAFIDEARRLARPGSRVFCHATAGQLMASQMLDRPAAAFDLLGAELLTVEPDAEAAGSFACMLFHGHYILLTRTAQVDLADAYLKRLEQLDEALGGRDPAVSGWRCFAAAMAAGARRLSPWEAYTLHGRAFAAFEAAGDRPHAEIVHAYRARFCAFFGAYDDAEEMFRALLPEGAPRGGLTGQFALLLRARGRASRGAHREALADVDELMKTRTGPGMTAQVHLLRARVLCGLGDLVAAEREAALGIERARTSATDSISGLCELARVRLGQGRAAEAAALARESAAARARTYGTAHLALDDLALVHVEALLVAGATEEARATLASVRAKLLAQADEIPDPELRRSFLQAVPAHVRLLELSRAWLE
ncbi:serine/threonine-protein kinase [Sorangium sp. So ce1078]|uniref:serine/threonine-protein kinase n=1 Tax=Sorangium sp. So ce1078 TaxID=3133329 RepID=UPI003F633C67